MLQSSHSGQLTVLDDFLHRVLLPAVLPALSYSSPISSFYAQIPASCHHQSTPNASDTSDPAPRVPFHHSAFLASLAYTSSTRALGARARNVNPRSIVTCTLRCTLACTVFLGLAHCQSGSSFHRDRVTCGKRRMTRFQSGVLFNVFVALAPIFLCPLLFRGPRIVRRHVLLSSR